MLPYTAHQLGTLMNVELLGAAHSAARIWITWERQRRNHSLSSALGAELFEIRLPGGRVGRYWRSIRRTLSILRRHSPELVFVQNPSIVLAALATTWGRLTRTPVVVDAHNAGVMPFEGRRAWANLLIKLIFRAARLTIVSNPALQAPVERAGGRAFALPDPMPSIGGSGVPGTAGPAQVLFICTWAPDEPYLEVIEAARLLGDGVTVHITGRSHGRELAYGRPLPPNVVLTGFLPEHDYESLLRRSDVVIDLTTREDCLVCGAYEAMAVGRPLLVSDTRALRAYFDRGTLYTDNTAGDIAARVREALGRLPALAAEMAALREARTAEWSARIASLERELARIVAETR